MSLDETVVSLAEIERRILTVRGQKVMLDSDLAHLYGVPTKRLNEQVRRNLGRFPPDFMFQLTAEEASALRSQFATSKPGRGERRYLPYGVPRIGRCLPNGGDDSGVGNDLISRDEAGFPRESLSHQDPVMHFWNLGQYLKPEDGC